MSLTGTLLAGVAGLKAQTNAMAVISDNIANLNTVGYKKSDATFSTLVVNSAATTTYSPGGVVSGRFALVDNQGTLQASNRPLDIAITGNGFLAVTDATTNGNQLYTRAGSFSQDAQGHLVNTNGMFLEGWALDQAGAIANVNQIGLVSVGTTNGVAVDTKNVSLGANLDATQALLSPATAGSTVSTTDLSGAGLVDENTDLTASGLNLIANGDDFTVTIGGVSTTVTIPAAGSFSLSDLETALKTAFPQETITLSNAGTATAALTFQSPYATTFADGGVGTDVSTLFGVAGATTTTTGTYAIGDMQSGANTPQKTLDIQIFDALGTAHTVTLGLNRVATNTWSYELYSSIPGVTYTQAGSDGEISGAATGRGLLSAGTITFNGDGSLNAVTATPSVAGTLPSGLNNQALYSGSPVAPSAIAINWANGSNASSTTFNLGTNALTDGMSQFASSYNVAFTNQDGSAVGLRTGITIDKDGFVIASFSNGATQKIFQVPITTFADPNVLQAQNGNTYSQTNGSGTFNWRIANTGGAGIIAPSSLESSNADLGDEFSSMIITQRAYSANAKTITTADEMEQELLGIIR
jgi:flagellar hook protein FlgE